jgi:hypothetical protein
MKKLLLLLFAVALTASAQTEPDYTAWNRLLSTYYDPAHGMNYGALKAKDAPALLGVRAQLARVNPAALTPKQRLAYWINVYNVNSVATVVENYPVDSIRDISTDPIVRLNVFKKERVPFQGALISLDQVENEKLREAFHDPRIHFAINCAAKSCPPIRTEAYTGAKVDAQLDDQVRRFVSANGVRFTKDGDDLVVHTTKIMNWFSDDFDKWAGGKAAFLRRYVAPDKQKLLDAAGAKIEFAYDDYDWALNDWKK